MCLDLKKVNGITPESLIAKRNIVCFKEGCILEDDDGIEYLVPIVYDRFRYDLDKPTDKVEMKLRESSYRDELIKVEDGYHSCIKSYEVSSINPNNVFIIPKGAKYYKGSINDSNCRIINGYVSDTLIWVGKVNSWKTIWNVIKYKLNFK